MKGKNFLNQLLESYAKGPNAQLTLVNLTGEASHDKAENQAVDLPRAVLTDVKTNPQKEILCK